MAIGIDGQSYDSEFDYHYNSTKSEDEPTRITIHPKQEEPVVEPVGSSQSDLNNQATPVPDSNSNAPASSVGLPTGLPEETKGFLGRLSIVNAFKGMLGGAEEAVTNAPTNLTQAFKAAAKAVSLPHDVMTGEVPAGSEEEVNRAADLAMMMVGAPAPVAGKLADGTLGSFAGVRSATVDRPKLYKAQNMEMEGLHPEDIWKETGFFRGADSRWRYEIPNDMSNLKTAGTDVIKSKSFEGKTGWEGIEGTDKIRIKEPDLSPEFLTTEKINSMTPDQLSNHLSGAQSLKDVLDNPELFKAYPFLKDFTVKHVSPTSEYKGYYSPSEQSIYISPAKADEFHSTLLHEVQHAIQEHEGFARGGNTKMFSSPEFENAKVMFGQKMDEFVATLHDKLTDPESVLASVQAKLSGNYERFPASMKANVDHNIAKAKEAGVYDKLSRYVDAAHKIDAAEKYHFDQYRKIMGEVEARNVQRRIDFNDMERYIHSPMSTEKLDIPRSEQINPRE